MESTKIELRYRRIQQIDDVTDLVAMLFPGNLNQQYAAAQILLALKKSEDLMASFSDLEKSCGISRRTLQRTRAKLARLGLIEHVTWMNSRYGGRDGWILSGRLSGGLRQLADRIDRWREDTRSDRERKERMLVALLRP